MHEIASSLEKKLESLVDIHHVKLLTNTSYLLLNQVKGNLDSNLLEGNLLQTTFQEHYISPII